MVHISDLSGSWVPPELPEDIVQGDMPGDKIRIEPQHVQKANILFPLFRTELASLLASHQQHRAVIGVCGGSGAGKSEIASLLGTRLKMEGIGVYILSGDNYPHRIPRDNDAERLRVYRTCGLKGLLMSGCYRDEDGKTLRQLWMAERDAEKAAADVYPWMRIYQNAAELSLNAYLGSPAEIDFDEINRICGSFKNGSDRIALRRMGREPEALWYHQADFSEIQVLIIEWTHANSDYLGGIDLSVFLHSSPEETLAHRRARARDGKTDSAFTEAVLRLEQIKLEHQAHKSKLIISHDGEILSYAQYRQWMAKSGNF